MNFLSLLTLHRYWLTADLMRDHFRRYMAPHREAGPRVEDPDLLGNMGIWYATLYVAAEGWFSYQVSDSRMDAFQADARFRLLKDFRDGTFHVQNEYIGRKIAAFIEVDGAAQWVDQLHRSLGETLVRELEARGTPSSAEVLMAMGPGAAEAAAEALERDVTGERP